MGLFKIFLTHHPDRVVKQNFSEIQKTMDQVSTYLQQLSGSLAQRLSSGSL